MSNSLPGELVKLFDSQDGELFKPKEKAQAPTPDDRLAESFKQVCDFVQESDRLPDINAEDMSEAVLAKRLESIKNNPEKVAALEQYDSLGLLEPPKAPESIDELFEKDELGIFSSEGNEVLDIKNVPASPKASPEDIAKRRRATDFAKYKKGFLEVQKKLKDGEFKLVKFTNVDQLKQGRYFVSGGLLLYVDNIGEEKSVHGRMKSRLRAVFENGTESNMYLRSLSSQLYYDGYCVVSRDEVYDDSDDQGQAKGYIYIVKSLSDDPKISTIQDLYKIGFSTTPVEKRIHNAKDDPTYLMSEVEVIESYRLTGEYNLQKVEHMIHRVFADAALDIKITDKYGGDYTPREWYCVPIEAIRHAIELIDSGEIINYAYDTDAQVMVDVD